MARPPAKSPESAYRFGVVFGAVLAASPLFGLVGVAYGLTRAFGHLQGNGIDDPHKLSESIRSVLFYPAVSVVFCAVGLVILTLSIIARERARRSVPPPLPMMPPR